MNLAVEKMELEEVSTRLQDALRNGRLSIDLRGVVLGFTAAMIAKAEGKRTKNGKLRQPSPRQIEIARKLVGEIRYHDGTEPENLIDRSDDPAAREQATNYKEF